MSVVGSFSRFVVLVIFHKRTRKILVEVTIQLQKIHARALQRRN